MGFKYFIFQVNGETWKKVFKLFLVVSKERLDTTLHYEKLPHGLSFSC